jgi:hypothetical protein
MIQTVEGITIPDSKLAREVTELVRDTESPLLFNHSTRVYYWGALAGKRRKLNFDPELLYIGAMFHDMGLTPACTTSSKVFSSFSAMSSRRAPISSDDWPPPKIHRSGSRGSRGRPDLTAHDAPHLWEPEGRNANDGCLPAFRT